MALIPWTGATDWTDGVTETLEWQTSILQSPTGAEQRIARRLTPRRTFELTTVAAGAERGAFENWLARAGLMVWAMPVWPDVVPLPADYAAGASTIHIPTAGRDFTAGDDVLLLTQPGWLAVSEVRTLSAVSPDSLSFTVPLSQNWQAGALVYPLRPAVLTDPPGLTRRGALMLAQVRFRLVSGNTNAAAQPGPLYRGWPVIEHAPDFSEDLSAEYQRLVMELDNRVGIPHRNDTAGRPFLAMQHTWSVSGRAEQQALRALFYSLRGRQRAVWIAGDPGDLLPVSGLNAGYIDVRYCALSDSAVAGELPGRQDVVITLADGRHLYRRVLRAVRLNSTTERLTLDGVGDAVPLSELASVSWLTLSRLNDDAVTWQHVTDADGLATVSVIFRGVTA